MSRNDQRNIEIARLEAIKHGASFSVEAGKNHSIGVISYNGQIRKTSISGNTKDQNIEFIIKKFVRRAIREMSA